MCLEGSKNPRARARRLLERKRQLKSQGQLLQSLWEACLAAQAPPHPTHRV